MSYLMLIRILAIVAPILLLCSLWWYAGSPRQSQEIGNTSQEVGVKTDEVGQGNTPTVVPKEPKAPVYRVLRVVDGDTLDIQTVGKVRLIGINSPESVKPDTMPECYGKEASEILKGLLGGESVRLVYDVERYDQYGRALAYVYRTPDGLFVNAELVRVGAAEAREYRPNTKQKEILEDFEAIARQERFGLWALCQ